MIAPTEGQPAPGFPRTLTYAPVALRRLRKLPRDAQAALVDALERYASIGVGDVIRLVAVRPPEYRLRVGDYRARFALTGAAPSGAVDVLWVGDRREAY